MLKEKKAREGVCSLESRALSVSECVNLGRERVSLTLIVANENVKSV